MQMGRNLRHFIVVEEGTSVMLDPRRETVGGAKRATPHQGQHKRQSSADGERYVAPRRAPERDRSGEPTDQQADRDARPEKAPQNAHAFSRASSRQPMSRRWNPSAKSIWSTARYARARALAKLSATAVTASTRPPFATRS